MLARIRYAILVTLVVSVSGLVYYQAGVEMLIPLVKQHSGPFSPVIPQMEAVFPLVLAIGIVFPWGFIIYGVWQREKVRNQRVVRR